MFIKLFNLLFEMPTPLTRVLIEVDNVDQT